MASIKTKFTVGLFIFIGMAIAVVAIIWLGMSKYLEKGQLYVAYFDESVQGLDRDSPVKYRGVPVGRVKSVGVAPDGTLVQVVMKIETDLEPEREDAGIIVAQLKSIGITGIMFIELDRKKPEDPDLSPKLTFDHDYPVIVTKPSDIKLFLEGVDEVLKNLKSFDGKALTDNAVSTLEKIDSAIDDIRLREISADIRSTLNNLNKILTESRFNQMIDHIDNAARSAEAFISTAQDTVRRFDNLLADNEKGISTAVREANGAIQNANQTVGLLSRVVSDNKQELAEAISGFNRSIHNLEGLLTDGHRLIQQSNSTFSELRPRLLVVIQQLEVTVENLKSFSENIADQPSQLLLGEPPAPRPTEPDRFENK